jgi:hypothetical protein
MHWVKETRELGDTFSALSHSIDYRLLFTEVIAIEK